MDMLTAVVYMMGGLFCIILSFYLALCFIQWMSDIFETKPWRYWK